MIFNGNSILAFFLPLQDIGIGILWALSLTALTIYIGAMATDITYVTLADGRRRVRRLPLLFRLLLPFTPNVTFFERERYARTRIKVEKRLVAGGYDTVIDARQFLALRVLFPLVLGPLLIGLLYAVFSNSRNTFFLDRQGMIYLFIMLLMYVYPGIWLKKIVDLRHRSIERALPWVLDLLTLSVEAGLDFMTAIRRIVERRELDALSEDLLRALREMQVGRTRKEALKDMAERIQHKDITSVVNALVQADELGVSIGSVLRIQADQIRIRRFQRAEKLGNEAPVKLLFPLICFIFPAVFLVLLGPIFLEMMRTGF